MAFEVFDNIFRVRMDKPKRKNKTWKTKHQSLISQIWFEYAAHRSEKNSNNTKLSNKCACMVNAKNAANVCTCVNKLSHIRYIWNIQSIFYVQYLSFVLYVCSIFSAAVAAVVATFDSLFLSLCVCMCMCMCLCFNFLYPTSGCIEIL